MRKREREREIEIEKGEQRGLRRENACPPDRPPSCAAENQQTVTRFDTPEHGARQPSALLQILFRPTTRRRFGAAIAKVRQSLTLTLTLYHSGPSLWRADTATLLCKRGLCCRQHRQSRISAPKFLVDPPYLCPYFFDVERQNSAR